MKSRIFVSHNAEIAHRLSQLPGKCQNIHGHSMQIELELEGELDENGILEGLDFGTLKRIFRNWIDTKLDHHLHLNESDEWARQLRSMPDERFGDLSAIDVHYQKLPGLVTWPNDPTTENMAKWIAEAMWKEFQAYVTGLRITIQETGTNGAECILP